MRRGDLMMTAPDRRLSFGIKTSQMGLGYEEILRIWREADQIPVFEHAWLWDHMVPLRGEITGAALEAWTLLAAPGRPDRPAAAGRHRDQQPPAFPGAAGEDGGDGRHRRRRSARFRDRRRGQPGRGREPRGAGVRGLRRAPGLSR